MTPDTHTSLTGTRFGDIEYTAEDVVVFPQGLIGFPALTQYVIVCPKPESAFRWLQSTEEPALAFLVTDPANYVPDYAPLLSQSVARDLGLKEDTARMVLTTVNIPRGKPEDMTVNLAGPILVNLETRTACQIVLEDEAYTTKYRVFHAADRKTEQVAA